MTVGDARVDGIFDGMNAMVAGYPKSTVDHDQITDFGCYFLRMITARKCDLPWDPNPRS